MTAITRDDGDDGYSLSLSCNTWRRGLLFQRFRRWGRENVPSFGGFWILRHRHSFGWFLRCGLRACRPGLSAFIRANQRQAPAFPARRATTA